MQLLIIQLANKLNELNLILTIYLTFKKGLSSIKNLLILNIFIK